MTTPIQSPNPGQALQDKPDTLLQDTAKIAVIFVFCAFFVAGWVAPRQDVFLGIFMGGVLAFANFAFLIKIVVKLLNQNYSGASSTILLILFKILFVAGTFVLSFKVLKVDVLAFAFGYLCLILALLILQMKRSGKEV